MSAAINSSGKKLAYAILEDVNLDLQQTAAFAATWKDSDAAAPGGLLLQPVEDLSQLAEVSKLMAAALGVFRARRGQHKHQRAV